MVAGVNDPYALGVNIPGFIKVPGNTAAQTATFRVYHPNGRIAFNIENDIAENNPAIRRCELNGVSTGVACPMGNECNASESCVDHTSYVTSTTVPPVTNATTGWTIGSCSNNGTAYAGENSCFDSNECRMGSCAENDSIRCRLDSDCATSCDAWSPGFDLEVSACSGQSSTPHPTGFTNVPVSFPANGGIQARECVGGIHDRKSCIPQPGNPNAQCSGGTCTQLGGGMYPFFLRYFQSNTGHCSGADHFPCIATSQCHQLGIGTCQTGKWCQSGIRRGSACSGLPGECPGGACVDQYTSRCNLNPGTACMSDSDCTAVGDTCNVATSPPSELRLQWNCTVPPDPSPGCGGPRPFVDVPVDHLAESTKNSNRQSIVQEIPFSMLEGKTYTVTGNYKVEFTGAYSSLGAVDPRRPLVSRAGLRTKCRNADGATGDNCGYDLTLFTTKEINGVTNGTCDLNNSICSTDADCTGIEGTVCNANWKPFSATLTKQNRDKVNAENLLPDDPAQSLEIECFAEAGARIWCDDISVIPANESGQSALESVDVWAVGDAGMVMRNNFNFANGILAGESWVDQQRPTTEDVRGLSAADTYHVWAAGDNEANKATIFRLSPGNVLGWAWIGSASTVSGLDPVGWVDFNCGNGGTCLGQPSAFGVNVDVTAGSPTQGQFSGSAWLGSADPDETADFGTCENKPTAGHCDVDTDEICTSDAQCQAIPGAGTTCIPSTECTAGVCKGVSSRQCSNDGQCYGTCKLNAGFRCMSDSDCKIKCSENPVACYATGWLSFDKSLTGTPPPEGPYTTPYNSSVPSTFNTAKFNQATDAVDGWARFQFGRCVNLNPAISSNLSCFVDSNCPTGDTCDWSGAPSVPAIVLPPNAASQAGWVKLRGDAVASPSGPNALLQCMDCTAGGTATTGTCKICASKSPAVPPGPATPIGCNSCDGCTVKRCSNTKVPCLDNTICGGGSTTCRAFGVCQNNSTTVCFSDIECPGSTCTFGSQCNTCAAGSCNQYGVSIDYNSSKSFVGLGYSPDLGWIDFSRVTLGGALFFQTKYGNIYSGGNIGGPTTGQAPGTPGGSSRCNATYRIISAGSITNFCTFSQGSIPSGPPPSPLSSPFISPNSERFSLPKAENQYISKIGAIDPSGLTSNASLTPGIFRNKYGDPIVTVGAPNTNTNVSSIWQLPCDSGSCSPKLLGRVIHVRGNLVIDRDITFNPGLQATSSTPDESGAGTFVVDGDLIANSNTFYYAPTSGGTTLSNRKSLPSVAFIVRGDITIAGGVSQMVGAYYSEKNVTVAGGDTSFRLSGLMIAWSFAFDRKFRGAGESGQEASELVVYDGRLQTNTPPGLASISSSLPNLRETLP